MPRAPENPSAPLRRAMLRYAASAFVALVALAIGSSLVLRRVGRDEAIRAAQDRADTLAIGVVEPALTDAMLQSDPAAIEAFDAIVERQIDPTGVRRVKIWDGDGTILYADEPRLIGERFPLDEGKLAVLANGGSDAGQSDLDEPENVYESKQDQLLEVYRRVTTPNGTPVLFETYFRDADVSSVGSRIGRAFAPIALGALALLALAQLPLAWILVRRIRRAQRDHEALLQSAVEASQFERRRIAQDLHDGVVQDLAGVSFTIAAALDTLRDDAPPDAVSALKDAAASTRQGIRQLRTLLVELYPPNLQQAGLESALSDLLARCRSHGIDTDLQFASVDLGPDVEALVYRTVQEALRNVVRHARAARVVLRVVPDDNGTAVVTVTDDGVGFDPTALAAPAAGHVGLPLLVDLARHSGARIVIDSAPGQGTSVALRVAMRRVQPTGSPTAPTTTGTSR